MKEEDTSHQLSRICDWLDRRKRVLLVSHERPDGDALCSVLSLFLGLLAQGKSVGAYFSCPVFPTRYQPLLDFPESRPGLFTGRMPDSAQTWDGLVCLDSATWERVDLPDGIASKRPALQTCNIDHHGDNHRFADINWVDGDYAATAQMILALLRYREVEISGLCANLLLAGLVADCGGFRFQNTDAGVLRDAAWLIDHGADFAGVVDTLFFNEPYGKLLLKSYLLEHAVFSFSGRLLYSVLEPAILEKFALTPADTEDCIDGLRAVSGVEVSCLVQPSGEGVRFSLRSRRLPYNVAEMAHLLGGGGHPMAAGVKMENIDLSEAIERFIAVAGRWFK